MWKALNLLLRRSRVWDGDARKNRTRERRHSSSAAFLVALTVHDADRELLSSVARESQMGVRFVCSSDEAQACVNELEAPVVLFDRDLPDAEWRQVVRSLSSAPHHPSVILASRVVDDYLWHEVIRWGGYDVLAKPLRSDDVLRSLRLALSYWRATALQMPAAHNGIRAISGS